MSRLWWSMVNLSTVYGNIWLVSGWHGPPMRCLCVVNSSSKGVVDHLWAVYELSMTCLWGLWLVYEFDRPSMQCLYTVYSSSKGVAHYLSAVYESSIVVYGQSISCLWLVYECHRQSMRCLCDVNGLLMGVIDYLWAVYESSLVVYDQSISCLWESLTVLWMSWTIYTVSIHCKWLIEGHHEPSISRLWIVYDGLWPVYEPSMEVYGCSMTIYGSLWLFSEGHRPFVQCLCIINSSSMGIMNNLWELSMVCLWGVYGGLWVVYECHNCLWTVYELSMNSWTRNYWWPFCLSLQPWPTSTSRWMHGAWQEHWGSMFGFWVVAQHRKWE